MNNPPPICLNCRSGVTCNLKLAVWFIVALLCSIGARADNSYYGTVENFSGDQIVVRTTKHSTGHWKVDANTCREGSVEASDWVSVDVTTSGHVVTLRFEERPTPHGGVIQKIHKQVLTVHSGPNLETWNVTETTVMDGVSQSDLQPGDEISVKLYKNHNLAKLRVVKTGIPVK